MRRSGLLAAEDVRRGLPFPVGVGIRRGADAGVPALFGPEEDGLGPRTAQRRRLIFALGRAAARDALGELGVLPVGIGSGPAGEPLWPDDIVGAISHTGDLAIAVVGRLTDYAGLGVDIERRAPGLSARAARLVCLPAELAWTEGGADGPTGRTEDGAGVPFGGVNDEARCGMGRAGDGGDVPTAGKKDQMGGGIRCMEAGAGGGGWRLGDGDEGNARRTMVFSAKEAVFKATYPIERVWLGFSDAELTWIAEKRAFEARLLKRVSSAHPVGALLQVFCTLTDAEVLSTTYVLPERV